MAYEARYCAFVDILGFKGIIDELAKGTITVEWLRDTLREVHKPPFHDAPSVAANDFRAHSISDGVCISTKLVDNGVVHLLLSLSALSQRLFRRGYYLRGSVVRGRLYHDEDMVFGEALVEAYRLESTVARFPRILLPKEIVDEYRTFAGRFTGLADDGFARQSADGWYHLNFFAHTPALLFGMRPESIAAVNEDAAMLQRRLDEVAADAKKFEKVQWLARQWNDAMRMYDGKIRLIVGLGLASISAEEARPEDDTDVQ